MAEVYTGASTWMLQVLSKNEYPVIMLQTSFSCTCDAVTAKTFTCYPQLTWHPAVCYYIVASPALSGTINLPSPFSPITDQLTDLLELSDLPLLPLHPQPVQEASPAPILAMEKTVTDSVAALQKCDEVWACHISITYQSLPLAINEDHEFRTGVTHELAEGQRCSGRGDCHGPLEDCLQMTIKVCIS